MNNRDSSIDVAGRVLVILSFASLVLIATVSDADEYEMGKPFAGQPSAPCGEVPTQGVCDNPSYPPECLSAARASGACTDPNPLSISLAVDPDDSDCYASTADGVTFTVTSGRTALLDLVAQFSDGSSPDWSTGLLITGDPNIVTAALLTKDDGTTAIAVTAIASGSTPVIFKLDPESASFIAIVP